VYIVIGADMLFGRVGKHGRRALCVGWASAGV
jgi:hypothetical protein